MKNNFTVFVVDDDASVRDSLCLLLGLHGWRTVCFDSAENFLKVFNDEWAGCILLDIRMSGMDGLTLLHEINMRSNQLSVIMITGHGDVTAAREAFRNKAIDFLEKPLEEKKLLAAIEEGMHATTLRNKENNHQNTFIARSIDKLTGREQQVMEFIVAGLHKNEIAAKLEISVRTVEVYKGRLMSKLGISSDAELVRLYEDNFGA